MSSLLNELAAITHTNKKRQRSNKLRCPYYKIHIKLYSSSFLHSLAVEFAELGNHPLLKPYKV